MMNRELRTDRLTLRRGKPVDLDPFAAMNADPAVMELFPKPLARAESDAFVARIESHFDQHGFGLWAVEIPERSPFAGFVGLWPATFEARFTPAVEVGWRLDSAHWGRGYATEAALATVQDGFERLGLTEIVSFTSAVNHRSRRVMEKLGMITDPGDDFDHPSVAAGDRLQSHVLYRLAAPES